MAYETKVITDERDVPDGFARICDITPSLRDQKRLSDAHTDGVIEAYKVTKTVRGIRNAPVWVNRKQAEAVIGVGRQAVAKPTPVETPFMLSNIDDRLASIDDKLCRICVALERVAEIGAALWGASSERLSDDEKAEIVGAGF